MAFSHMTVETLEPIDVVFKYLVYEMVFFSKVAHSPRDSITSQSNTSSWIILVYLIASF
jgi:hypothetical protein